MQIVVLCRLHVCIHTYTNVCLPMYIHTHKMQTLAAYIHSYIHSSMSAYIHSCAILMFWNPTFLELWISRSVIGMHAYIQLIHVFLSTNLHNFGTFS